MRNTRLPSVRLAVAVLLLASLAYGASGRDPTASSTQLIVVTTSDWNTPEGTLQRFQRSRPGKHWEAIGAPVAVVVGKNGLGWGSGVVSADSLQVAGATAPVKKEGDGKAPAGIFHLSSAFGYAEEAPRGWKMPYVHLTPLTECVDDPASKFYNRVLDRTGLSGDWKSSEHMLRSDELYRWGIVVDHNASPPKAGDGSCIFLHIWRGPGQGTVGCTAMAPERLEAILGWLAPLQKPLLVQLPAAEYSRLRGKWKLPERANPVLPVQ